MPFNRKSPTKKVRCIVCNRWFRSYWAATKTKQPWAVFCSMLCCSRDYRLRVALHDKTRYHPRAGKGAVTISR